MEIFFQIKNSDRFLTRTPELDISYTLRHPYRAISKVHTYYVLSRIKVNNVYSLQNQLISKQTEDLLGLINVMPEVFA